MTYKKKPSGKFSKQSVRTMDIEAPTELLKFLCLHYNRSKAKSMLKNKLIAVNGKITSQYNEPLNPGDRVMIHPDTSTTEKRMQDLSIVYEDKDIIVVDKHAGLLSISTAKENHRTAFRILSDHVKLQNPDNRIFIVHRLDRETSGLMVFAKSEAVKKDFQENWQDWVTERSYLAIVQGKPEPWSNTLQTYMYESKALKVHITKNPEEGQLAITHYKTIKSKGQYALLHVWLDTGRKNQIRVQLNEIGHPVLGDLKYGGDEVENPIGRLALHAWVLNFKHPVTGELKEFKTAIPRKFARVIG